MRGPGRRTSPLRKGRGRKQQRKKVKGPIQFRPIPLSKMGWMAFSSQIWKWKGVQGGKNVKITAQKIYGIKRKSVVLRKFVKFLQIHIN
jgi:hypothetical protein